MSDRWWTNSSGKPRGSVMTIVISGAIAIVSAAVGGVWAVHVHTGQNQVTAADRVSQCESHHHLSTQMVVHRRTVKSAAAVRAYSPPSPNGILATFQFCAWPPTAGQNADGYASISVTTVAGPGSDEASGEDYADRVDSPCGTTHLVYDSANPADASRERLTITGGRFWVLFKLGALSKLRTQNRERLTSRLRMRQSSFTAPPTAFRQRPVDTQGAVSAVASKRWGRLPGRAPSPCYHAPVDYSDSERCLTAEVMLAAAGWLRARKILLPGVSVLARLVSQVRAEQTDRLHQRNNDAVPVADRSPDAADQCGGGSESEAVVVSFASCAA